MKKLLTILGVITLIGTTSTNVIACGESKNIPITHKVNISTKIITLTTNIKAKTNSQNYFLKEEIEKCKEFKDLQPKLKDYQIYYYNDAQGKTNVTYMNQQAGDLYIVITANDNDLNYQGATNPIKITLKQKIDLKTKITTLTTDIIANPNNKNNDLDTEIKNTNEVKNLNPNLTNLTINYFSDEQGKNDISNEKQKAGDLYVVITADTNDATYQGATNPIKITLKQKIDLKNITELTGLNLKVNSGGQYFWLNNDIIMANEFKNKKIKNFSIKYFSDAQTEKDITFNQQQTGDLYIVITANNTTYIDDNYQGSTNPLKITLKW